MKYFQDFIANEKLIFLLREIENFLGYKIKAEIMPPEDRVYVRMAVSKRDEWTLLYIPELPQGEATFCHELMHLVLWIEGYPAFTFEENWTYLNLQRAVIYMLSNLVLHINVWNMTYQYGFDEKAEYKITDLIKSVLEDSPPAWIDPGILLAVSSSYLTQGLLMPARPEEKQELRGIAAKKIPNSLKFADSMISTLHKFFPLTPESTIKALQALFDIINVPKGIINPIFSERIAPDFRARFKI
jgi:hypothetical protein